MESNYVKKNKSGINTLIGILFVLVLIMLVAIVISVTTGNKDDKTSKTETIPLKTLEEEKVDTTPTEENTTQTQIADKLEFTKVNLKLPQDLSNPIEFKIEDYQNENGKRFDAVYLSNKEIKAAALKPAEGCYSVLVVDSKAEEKTSQDEVKKVGQDSYLIKRLSGSCAKDAKVEKEAGDKLLDYIYENLTALDPNKKNTETNVSTTLEKGSNVLDIPSFKLKITSVKSRYFSYKISSGVIYFSVSQSGSTIENECGLVKVSVGEGQRSRTIAGTTYKFELNTESCVSDYAQDAENLLSYVYLNLESLE
jgi:hypothetical protein